MRAWLVIGVVVLAALAVPAAARAAGGTYGVVECGSLNRAAADAIQRDSPEYAVKDYCADASNGNSFAITSRLLAVDGKRGLVRFPTGSDQLGIVGVTVDAKLRGDDGSHPRLWLADRRLNEVTHFASTDSPGTSYHHYTWSTDRPGAFQFVASLGCKRDTCGQSDQAKVLIRNVRLTVADYGDPVVTPDESGLLGGGWLRGVQDLSVAADDTESGMRSLSAIADAFQIAVQAAHCQTIPTTALAARIAPCETTSSLQESVSTSAAPFHEGTLPLSLCATDFAGNSGCALRSLRVDNSAPYLAFSNTQAPRDPEKISAPAADATSGLAAGQIYYRALGSSTWIPLETLISDGALRAYVDSTAVPAGNYEFMASVSDIAGNQTTTTVREDGQPMVLLFPLKSAVRLYAHLVPGGERREAVDYGQDSKVSGRLTKASGTPIGHAEVTVVEHFGRGALINRRVRRVRTRSDGSFGERIPAGPSRAITVTYNGSTQNLSREAKAGRLVVKSKAGFHTSKRRVAEGHSVLFSGRVFHKGARIPDGGKLIELQVRDGRHWNTVRQAFYTRPDGRYKLRYRFRADYVSNARFRFRVKVAREQGWPYRAPVRTRSRSLVVVAR